MPGAERAEDPVGLYIHVPFCAAKCPYCDFYSQRADESGMDRYAARVIAWLEAAGRAGLPPADTLYFGGGTPSLLGGCRLSAILRAARRAFALEGAEITVEVNPGGLRPDAYGFFSAFREAGGNRVSIGLQAAADGELRRLGRGHTARQAAATAREAIRAGIDNLSMDLMIAIPGQTEESLTRSAVFCREAGASHVSAYLLKLEPGTAFYRRREALELPGEEETCALYETACDALERLGYRQYEISNFAVPGRESRHNLKYWRCEEYLGVGPAAHSFCRGRRFYYRPDLQAFLRGAPPEPDGPGGGFTEYAMLALRLTEGLREAGCLARFGMAVPQACRAAARRYEAAGLTLCTPEGIRLTRRGFLVSNALLAEILQDAPP